MAEFDLDAYIQQASGNFDYSTGEGRRRCDWCMNVATHRLVCEQSDGFVCTDHLAKEFEDRARRGVKVEHVKEMRY